MFSPDILWGNISSQSETGNAHLYNTYILNSFLEYDIVTEHQLHGFIQIDCKYTGTPVRYIDQQINKYSHQLLKDYYLKSLPVRILLQTFALRIFPNKL